MPRLFLIVFLNVVLFQFGFTQKNEGDTCVEAYTNTVGRCTKSEECVSAVKAFQQNRIRPTYCDWSAFGGSLVCCRDNSSILQTPSPNRAGVEDSDRPVWGGGGDDGDGFRQDRRRISERKCEEYSREVTLEVGFVPLLPESEVWTTSHPKCEFNGVQLIVGGKNAETGEFPHMAALGWINFNNGYDFNCGGTLISSRFVLTAGHCTRSPGARNPEPVIVRLGDRNLDPKVDDKSTPIDVPIKSIIKHPEYKPPQQYNDIALIELNAPVELSKFIRPACIWTKDTISEDKAIATGWGVTSDGPRAQRSNELQKVALSIYDNAQCDVLLAGSRNRNWKGFAPTQLCAGDLDGDKDTCQGDSGAPLQITSRDNQCIYHIIAITSFGGKCAQINKPAIYTRVSAYVDWIEAVVWPGSRHK